MFVAIENNEMNVPQVLDWINRTKKTNNNVISPEFAMEILGKTNFYGHIKAVLKNIKENCKTKEDVLPYKEFILSCVDRREMSEQAMADLVAMAKLCCCKDEFDEVKDEPKCYLKNDCYKVVVVKSKEEFEALEGNDLRIFFDADEIYLTWCDLDKVKKIRFREGAEVDLWQASNLPKDLDVSMCSKVNLIECDLDGLKLKFREGAEVYLSSATNLPKDLYVSMCSRVDLSRCDLKGMKLKFRERAKVYLDSAENLPKDLDFSMCSKVNLSWCNLEGLELKFREGAEVVLHGAYNLPKELDVSMCSKVNMDDCDLNRVEKIKFREGAEINLMDAVNLPQNFDISMCSKVNMIRCDLTGVEKIKFKDKEQEEEFMKDAKNFNGKVEYVGDDEKGKVMPMNNGGMEM